jgi:hypothetical protein
MSDSSSEEDRRIDRPKNAYELQRIELEKLMKNPVRFEIFPFVIIILTNFNDRKKK